MTFENALRRLAEREPEKYKCFIWAMLGEGGEESNRRFTQDDIDEILAPIGWEYELHHYPAEEWGFWIWKIKNDYGDGIDGEIYISKLEAAKAALVAVVERVYP